MWQRICGSVAIVAGLGLPMARADDGVGRDSATVVIPVIDGAGGATYCTHNRSAPNSAPMVEGGYRVTGLAPGRYAVRLELPHEHVDVLVTVANDAEVIVPPVVARGRCLSIEVSSRPSSSPAAARDRGASWSLRFGRSYRRDYAVSAVDPWLQRRRRH
jgi:hypothetical protein